MRRMVVFTLAVAWSIGCTQDGGAGDKPQGVPTSATTKAPSARNPTPSPTTTAVAAPTIVCGSSTCRAGAEICCDFFQKKQTSCKPAPADTSENGLLNACGTR